MDAAKNSVAGHIEYRTDLFKRSTVEHLVKHFEVVPFAKPKLCKTSLLLHFHCRQTCLLACLRLSRQA